MNNDNSIAAKFYGLQKEIETLEAGNKELKKHLEELKNGYKIKLEKLLAQGIEPDLEDFYLAEIEGKANDYDKLLNQQKKFIKYLESEKDRFAWGYSDSYKDSSDKIRLVNEDISNEVNRILRKYKSVIGDIDE